MNIHVFLSCSLYICIYDILNKIKQQPKLETSYMFVVSLKHLLSATENLNRIKDIVLGLVLVILGRASLKKWVLFYVLLSSENDLYAKKNPTNSLTCILTSVNIYDVNVI